jgi:hypothetical protein
MRLCRNLEVWHSPLLSEPCFGTAPDIIIVLLLITEILSKEQAFLFGPFWLAASSYSRNKLRAVPQHSPAYAAEKMPAGYL